MATRIYSRGRKDDAEIESTLPNASWCIHSRNRHSLHESPRKQRIFPKGLKQVENVAEGMSKNSKQHSDKVNHYLKLGKDGCETPSNPNVPHQATSLPDLIEPGLLQNGMPKSKGKPSPHMDKIRTVGGNSSTEEDRVDQISAARKRNPATTPVKKKSCHPLPAMVDKIRSSHQENALKKFTKSKHEEIISVAENDKHRKSCKVGGMSGVVTSGDKLQVGDNTANAIIPDQCQNSHKENERHSEEDHQLSKKKSHTKIKKGEKETQEKPHEIESPRYRAPTESSKIRTGLIAEQISNLKVRRWSPRYLRMKNSRKGVPRNTGWALCKKKHNECKKSYWLDNFRHCVSVPKLHQNKYQQEPNSQSIDGGKNYCHCSPAADISSLLKHKDCTNSYQFGHIRESGSVPKHQPNPNRHNQCFQSGVQDKNDCHSSLMADTVLQLRSRGTINSTAKTLAKESTAGGILEQCFQRRVKFNLNSNNSCEKKKRALRTEDTVNYHTVPCSEVASDVLRVAECCRHKKYPSNCRKYHKENTNLAQVGRVAP